MSNAVHKNPPHLQETHASCSCYTHDRTCLPCPAAAEPDSLSAWLLPAAAVSGTATAMRPPTTSYWARSRSASNSVDITAKAFGEAGTCRAPHWGRRARDRRRRQHRAACKRESPLRALCYCESGSIAVVKCERRCHRLWPLNRHIAMCCLSSFLWRHDDRTSGTSICG